jgi:hypothetical protein
MTTSDRWLMVFACSASALFGAGVSRWLPTAVASAQDTTVRAQRFELVDDSGRVRAVLGNLGYQSITTPLMGLAFYDSEQRPLISFGLAPEGDAAWSAWKTEIVKEKDRITTRQGPRTVMFFGSNLDFSDDVSTRLSPGALVISDRNGQRVTATVVDGKGVVRTE